MSDEHRIRMDRILKAHGLKKDIELYRMFKDNIAQPQISYWRNRGFYKTTGILIDSLLDIIESHQKRKK